MEKILIKVIDVCRSGKIDLTFVRELDRNGLIEIITIEGTDFVDEENLAQLEQYYIWHYELELNLEGIEVIERLVERIRQLQEEIRGLQK